MFFFLFWVEEKIVCHFNFGTSLETLEVGVNKKCYCHEVFFIKWEMKISRRVSKLLSYTLSTPNSCFYALLVKLGLEVCKLFCLFIGSLLGFIGMLVRKKKDFLLLLHFSLSSSRLHVWSLLLKHAPVSITPGLLLHSRVCPFLKQHWSPAHTF